jgi:glutamate-1-semialdehyde 2,1-aminomutase
LSAGIAGLSKAYTPEAATTLNARGEALRGRLNTLAEKSDVAMTFTGFGSMMGVHMTRDAIRSPEDAAKGNAKLRELLFFDLLAQGIHIMPKRCLMALSLPIGDAECDRLVAGVDEFISVRRSLLG